MKTIQTSAGKVSLDEIVHALLKLKVPELKGISKKLLFAIEQHDLGKYPKREKELIEKIKYGGPSEQLWKRHDELVLKSTQGTMTDEENQELLALLPDFGKWAVERTKLMLELAKIWNVRLDEVVKKLDIKPRPALYA